VRAHRRFSVGWPARRRCRGLDFRTIPATLSGSYIAAVALTSPAISVFSVHVGPESWKNQEALEPWIVRQVHAEPSVVGGDINTNRAYSAKHAAFFDRLSASGVHDCHWSEHGRETPSFWGKQSTAAVSKTTTSSRANHLLER
jgi:hypothetical protein